MNIVEILFPSSPESRRVIDPSFASEQVAAQAKGFGTQLYSHEAVEGGQESAFITNVGRGRRYLLRGWMMTAAQYEMLELAVRKSGAELVVDSDAYAEAHYLPYSYKHIESDTAESIWMEGDDETTAWKLYQNFRSGDALIKDWVKSAKHRWKEACFLPANSDESEFVRIFRAFRQSRGHLFNLGVVLRRFVRLSTKGEDLRGFPLVDEYRLFFFGGSLLAMPDAEGSDELRKAIGRFASIARKFRSPFITLDVAKLESGDWIVIEAGDGGVSGLPVSIDPNAFYEALANTAQTEGA